MLCFQTFIKFILRFSASLLLLFLMSCNTKQSHPARSITSSFYYWKSVFALSAFEKQQLKEHKVNTLYIKYFDVDWNATTNNPVPVAQLRVADKSFFSQNAYKIIPTVFISNECIFKIDSSQCERLADKILLLIKDINQVNTIGNISEIQIDCDWTASTREKYFSILKALQHKDSALSYSATIRLHQVKYLQKTGVPPVSRGLLMCYNMGNLKDASVTNSILDVEEFKKYSSNLGSYPLPLDVGLPLFEWYVLFRHGTYIGLVRDVDVNMLKSVSKQTGNRYEMLAHTTLNGYGLKKGDILRHEQSDYNEIMKTTRIVSDNIKTTELRISLYHLDSLILKKYTTDEIENIFNSLR